MGQDAVRSAVGESKVTVLFECAHGHLKSLLVLVDVMRKRQGKAGANPHSTFDFVPFVDMRD